jgi:hypothetical protein
MDKHVTFKCINCERKSTDVYYEPYEGWKCADIDTRFIYSGEIRKTPYGDSRLGEYLTFCSDDSEIDCYKEFLIKNEEIAKHNE